MTMTAVVAIPVAMMPFAAVVAASVALFGAIAAAVAVVTPGSVQWQWQ